MSVLVTGGDGFVGQYLLRELLANGADVVASVQRLPPRPSVLERQEVDAANWKQAEILDAGTLFRLVASEKPDLIVHLAGFSSGALARRAPGKALSLNAVGTLNLCASVGRVREEFADYSPRILVMGSGEAYGSQSRERLSEEMALRPNSPYGLSKACQEQVAHAFRRSHQLDTVVARSFNLVGPGQAPHFAVPDFSLQVAAIAAGDVEPLLEVGNLDVERDFTDVRDAVRGLRVISELEKPSRTYNVCSGRPVSIRQLVEWIVDEAKVEVEIRVVAERVRAEERPRIVGNPRLLEREAGWKPARDLEDSVRGVYRWARAAREKGTRTESDRLEGEPWR
ncbi:MAG: GDP-mannose 4,6-dehydratase [Gemmatimonadales bacterium]